MKQRLLSEHGTRTFAVVLETGEEVVQSLEEFADREGITGASFTAIGAFSNAVLAFFDPQQNEYLEIPINEQVEVLTLAGNLGVHQDEPKVHAHVVLGMRDAATRGGHLMRATVKPTLEVVISETEGALQRRIDLATGLPLIQW